MRRMSSDMIQKSVRTLAHKENMGILSCSTQNNWIS
jgi:hypothetical protein